MKKLLIFFSVMLVLSVYPLYNFFSSAKVVEGTQADLKEGTDILSLYSVSDVQTVENDINEFYKKIEQEKLAQESVSKKVTKTLKKLESGKTTYRKVFKNVYIVGDSLMHGLNEYDILNSNNLITQVSASLYHLSDNMEKIVGLNPPVLILHYGINMIGTKDAHLESYISLYAKLIKELKKNLPETRIVVSGLFPVDRDIAKAERFKNISAYNKALKSMCKKQKVEFLNSSSVLKEHPECYASDGIHLSKSFYEKYWLRFIIEKLEIVG